MVKAEQGMVAGGYGDPGATLDQSEVSEKGDVGKVYRVK